MQHSTAAGSGGGLLLPGTMRTGSAFAGVLPIFSPKPAAMTTRASTRCRAVSYDSPMGRARILRRGHRHQGISRTTANFLTTATCTVSTSKCKGDGDADDLGAALFAADGSPAVNVTGALCPRCGRPLDEYYPLTEITSVGWYSPVERAASRRHPLELPGTVDQASRAWWRPSPED